MLILPNAWDVPSARVFEDAAFPAVATSSAALAVSLGYPDGEKIGKEELFFAVRKIVDRLAVPLSVDVESGFGATLDELSDTIRRVVAAGGVGVNIEDISSFEGRTLYPIEKQVKRIRTVRSVSSSLGVSLVINARTDAYRFAAGDEKAKFQEAVRRANAYAEADADCLYPMGLTDKGSISAFVKAVKRPVNIMARKGAPTVAELERLGVKRLSLGPGPMYAAMGLLRKVASELKERGTYEALLSGAITFDELNALAEPRRPT
jgi:2-methylisocitrate lyase-like PEP mutase family enzyme